MLQSAQTTTAETPAFTILKGRVTFSFDRSHLDRDCGSDTDAAWYAALVIQDMLPPMRLLNWVRIGHLGDNYQEVEESVEAIADGKLSVSDAQFLREIGVQMLDPFDQLAIEGRILLILGEELSPEQEEAMLAAEAATETDDC